MASTSWTCRRGGSGAALLVCVLGLAAYLLAPALHAGHAHGHAGMGVAAVGAERGDGQGCCVTGSGSRDRAPSAPVDEHEHDEESCAVCQLIGASRPVAVVDSDGGGYVADVPGRAGVCVVVGAPPRGVHRGVRVTRGPPA